MVRELTTEVQTVTIGQVRSTPQTLTTVTTLTSIAVTLTLRTATVTTASAFVRFLRINLVPNKHKKAEQIYLPSPKSDGELLNIGYG